MTQDIPRVLIYGRTATTLEECHRLLQGAGLHADRMEGFSEALTGMEQRLPALVLMDGRAKEEAQFLDALVRRGWSRQLPVLIITSRSRKSEEIYNGKYPGWIEYLLNPVPQSFLLQKIQAYLDVFVARAPSQEESLRLKRLEAEKESLAYKLNRSQNLTMLGRLASGVTHDVNNVLGGILGYAEMAKAKFGGDNPDLRRYAESIIAFTKRAGDLTKEILSFASGTRNKTQNVDLHDLLTEAADLLSHTIDKKYEINKKLSAQRHWVVANPALVQNAVINLALNGRDAMPHGGTLLLETSNLHGSQGPLLASGDRLPAGDYVRFTVRDSGSGMDDETQAKIFQPFFTTKEDGMGTGLGLSSVLKTMLEHNGGVGLDSVRGEGTAFHLYFPIATADDDREPDSKSSEPRKGNGQILIVDDEEGLRDILCEMLGDSGYEVHTASDAEEAVRVYKRIWDKVGLVLIDVNLPKASGQECFQSLRQINPDVKAILATGVSMTEVTEKILADGVVGFIQKPFEINQLLDTIGEVMSGK